ncbi:OLC1v1013775C1 [Oldenlandia corymbosa var. corymbosa]|uniref:OLC1v1013775C1 n=1 Tax=Oldenlandia corymbosa var. corymbosa TaxID=529605 RepID=A0AAV1DZ75_OLDCO|nr:OLC1v1013775C1 [Oldenlandia corymbosa var. corymbosa]
MGDPEPESEFRASPSSELSVHDIASSTNSNKWEEILRKMLPTGAPLPDEDHLDYSITVDYQGPPPCLPPSRSGSIPKPSKFISPYKTHHSILISRKSDISVERVYRDRVNSDKDDGISASCSSLCSDLLVVSRDDEKFQACVGNCSNRIEDEPYVDSSLNVDSNDGICGVKNRRKVKGCSRCGGGGRLSSIWGKRERCIVCGAEYCKNCVLKGMGSMPEGRKCVGCIGKPIDEVNREKLGKCSRMLERVCSGFEVKRIMKAEKECRANQIRPEQVVVNGRPLKEAELAEIMGCANPPCNLRPGRYWYDEDSGLWGQEGEKPDRFISAKLHVGGKLLVNASNGNTKVYINGREITKLELRILKLAKVQSLRDTHFWVYEDGSYEEEGQNNIRGNIWAKVSTRLICSLFSLPVPRGIVDHPKEDSATFPWRAVSGYLEHENVNKLLLLGLEGSGSSAIFKQAKFTYGKFTAQELQDIRSTIQSNLFRYLSILLEGQEYFEDEAFLTRTTHELTPAEKSAEGGDLLDGTRQPIHSIKPRLKKFCDWLLDTVAKGDFEAFFPAAAREYGFILYEVWQDPAIQETYKRMKDLHWLPDVAKYFLDQAIEISSNEYQPSEEHILYAEGVTTKNGLSSFEFLFEEKTPNISERYDDDVEVHSPSTNYQLIHIKSNGWFGGCKWIEMFEGIRAVVFCVSLIDYDQVEEHADESMSNKMLASRSLLETLARHPTFENTPFVLLLNKYDAFEEKLELVPLTVCDWFSDFHPMKPYRSSHSIAHQAYYYIALKFKALYTSITGKKLFVWQTRARDQSSVNEALNYIIEVIKWDDETRKMSVMFDDDSFGSSESTRSPSIQQD